ncbi:MAG: hypothetical protein IJZ96_01785 [Lachnospiraceae bacterium]|nr:hypothetical protein [Lachnospiraceae bacterium]
MLLVGTASTGTNTLSALLLILFWVIIYGIIIFLIIKAIKKFKNSVDNSNKLKEEQIRLLKEQNELLKNNKG